MYIIIIYNRNKINVNDFKQIINQAYLCYCEICRLPKLDMLGNVGCHYICRALKNETNIRKNKNMFTEVEGENDLRVYFGIVFKNCSCHCQMIVKCGGGKLLSLLVSNTRNIESGRIYYIKTILSCSQLI